MPRATYIMCRKGCGELIMVAPQSETCPKCSLHAGQGESWSRAKRMPAPALKIFKPHYNHAFGEYVETRSQYHALQARHGTVEAGDLPSHVRYAERQVEDRERGRKREMHAALDRALTEARVPATAAPDKPWLDPHVASGAGVDTTPSSPAARAALDKGP